MTGRTNVSVRTATLAGFAALVAAPFATPASAGRTGRDAPLSEHECLERRVAGSRVHERRRFTARVSVALPNPDSLAIDGDDAVGLRIGAWTCVGPVSSDSRWKPGKTSATIRVLSRAEGRHGGTTIHANWRSGTLQMRAKSAGEAPLADDVGSVAPGPLSLSVDASVCLGDQILRLRGTGNGEATGDQDASMQGQGRRRVDLAANAVVVSENDDVQAPRISIRTPSFSADGSVTVAGAVRDDRGLGSISWTVDGLPPTNAPVVRDPYAGPLDDVETMFAFALPVAVGAHVVRVEAIDAAGNVGAAEAGFVVRAATTPPGGTLPGGSPPPAPSPVNLSRLRTAKWGAEFVDVQGRVQTWGYNTRLPTLAPGGVPTARYADGNVAVLADGTVMNLHSEGKVGDPHAVAGLSNVVDVRTSSAGCYYSALDASGAVWSWGPDAAVAPTKVAGLPALQSISVGWNHAVAVDREGGVWAWGGSDGPPHQVAGITHAREAAASQFDRLNVGAAVLEDGSLWMWGDALSGQLGSAATSRTTPPFQVAGVSDAVSVALGYNHVLVVLADGTVLARGGPTSQVSGYWGELGDGTMKPHLDFAPVPGLTGVVHVAAGAHTSHALLADGTIRAWGQNTYGTLGDGTTTDRTSPVVVLPAK